MQKESICAFGEILFDDFYDYKKLGGAPFNYTYHLNKLSVNTRLISRIGNDTEGSEIISTLVRNSIPKDFIQPDKYHKTGKVMVKLNKEKVPEFQIMEDRAYDYIEYDKSLLDFILKKTTLLYFGTLAQRSVTSRSTLNSLLNRGINYFCDINLRQKFYTKEVIVNSLIAANLVKMNVDELRVLNVLLYNGNRLDLTESANKLLNDYNLDLLSITLGGDGSLLMTKNESHTHREKADNLVNTVGAGDAYSAILTIGFLKKWDLQKTNIIASKFAADICGIEGAVPGDDNFYNKYRTMINEK